MLFVGPSGTGKTTCARIVANHLSKTGVFEINCGVVDAMETVRYMNKEAGMKTLSGEPQVWILDEFQAFSRAPFAQNGCLKIFEDAKNSYFIVCTTDSKKILPTIRNRAQTITFNSVPSDDLESLVSNLAKTEKIKIKNSVCKALVKFSEGSPRRALVMLDRMKGLSTDEQLKILDAGDEESQTIDLCRALLANTTWAGIAKILAGLRDIDAEKIRYAVLGYHREVMLKSIAKSGRCYEVIEAFRDNTFDCGHAGLAAMAFLVSK